MTTAKTLATSLLAFLCLFLIALLAGRVGA